MQASEPIFLKFVKKISAQLNVQLSFAQSSGAHAHNDFISCNRHARIAQGTDSNCTEAERFAQFDSCGTTAFRCVSIQSGFLRKSSPSRANSQTTTRNGNDGPLKSTEPLFQFTLPFSNSWSDPFSRTAERGMTSRSPCLGNPIPLPLPVVDISKHFV